MILNSRAYEILRWLVSIVIPAVIVFFDTLAKAWGWDIPTEAITTSLSALELFLGTIFGISKLSYDKRQAFYEKGQAELDALNAEVKAEEEAKPKKNASKQASSKTKAKSQK